MSKKHNFSDIYSPSADLIGGNEYLISIILLCLPVRSLIQFKSVSKQWHSFISNPQFGLNHTLENSVSRIPSGLFFRKSLTCAKTFDAVSISIFGYKIPSFVDTVELPADVPTRIRNALPVSILKKIVQSCNGLILVQYSSYAGFITLYCVCNLVTKQQKFVPLPPLPYLAGASPWHNITCFLAFDPLVSPHYKIVGMEHNMYGQASKFFIFTSETGEWKHTNVTTQELTEMDTTGVYCNGIIYWIPYTYSRFLHCSRFDVEAENLTVISMPRRPQMTHTPSLRYFGGFNGHLNLVYVCDASVTKFNVLELNDITHKWSIKYRVDISSLISLFPEIVLERRKKIHEYAFSILSVITGEKEEDSALIMTIPGKVVSYRFKCKKVDVLCELFPQNEIKMNFHYATAYPFVASLYPL